MLWSFYGISAVLYIPQVFGWTWFLFAVWGGVVQVAVMVVLGVACASQNQVLNRCLCSCRVGAVHMAMLDVAYGGWT